jgi:hypothetical protein
MRAFDAPDCDPEAFDRCRRPTDVPGSRPAVRRDLAALLVAAGLKAPRGKPGQGVGVWGCGDRIARISLRRLMPDRGVARERDNGRRFCRPSSPPNTWHSFAPTSSPLCSRGRRLRLVHQRARSRPGNFIVPTCMPAAASTSPPRRARGSSAGWNDARRVARVA